MVVGGPPAWAMVDVKPATAPMRTPSALCGCRFVSAPVITARRAWNAMKNRLKTPRPICNTRSLLLKYPKNNAPMPMPMAAPGKSNLTLRR